MAFDRLGPIGLERGDWQAARIAEWIARAHSGKGNQKFDTGNFLLEWKWGTEQARKTPDEVGSKLLALIAAHNVEVEGAKGKK